MLTQEELKSKLIYDPESGIFTKKNGKRTGYIFDGRYIRMRINGRPFKAHRLAWLYMTGRWPLDQIDHIDGNGLNNKFANLREATRVQNNHNSAAKARKYDLPRGVSAVHKSKKFRAQISIGNRKKSLGTFQTPEDAGEFYELAAEMLHGEYALHLSRGATQKAAKHGEQQCTSARES